MRCPRGDGELIERRASGVGGIPITYLICLGCLGHWTGAFDANYFPLEALTDSGQTEESQAFNFRCPQCQEPLERSHSEAIAPDILAWYCTSGHGYFFPRGHLRKFRTAQVARVSYHKLWQIPTPAIRSVLLSSMILFMILTSSILVSQIRQRQRSESQAQSIIESRQVIVSGGRVAIFAQTVVPSQLRITIEALKVNAIMKTGDGLTHEISLPDVASGMYIFTLTVIFDEKEIKSPVYEFFVPKE